MNEGREQPDKDLSLQFQLFWEGSGEGEIESSFEWFGIVSHELWDKFGVDYQTLTADFG